MKSEAEEMLTSRDYTDEQAKECAKITPKREKLIERLNKVCEELAAEGCWFFNDGALHVMATGRDGNVVMHPALSRGNVDQRFIIGEVSSILSKGGDW